MRNQRAWPQQCWKSCANGSNIVALCFGDHGTKEMSGDVGWKVWPISNFAQQHATTSNNMQQDVQTDTTCNIQQCCIRLYSALLQRTVSLKCLPIHVHLYALLVKRQKANSQTNISRPVIRIKAKHTSKRSVRVVFFGLLLITNSNFYSLILTLSVLKVASVKNSQKFEIFFVENP